MNELQDAMGRLVVIINLSVSAAMGFVSITGIAIGGNLLATLGVVPAAVSNGTGSQTQKLVAVVVIGGSLTIAVLTRALQLPLLVVAHRWPESGQVFSQNVGGASAWWSGGRRESSR